MVIITNGLKYNEYDLDDPRFRIKPYQQISSSCTGALMTSLMMTPLDVVKTRLQTQQRNMLSNKCYLYCNGLMDHLCPCTPEEVAAMKKQQFTGTIDAFGKITRSEGVSSLWSGLGPTLILALPTTITYFVVYEQFRVRLKDNYMKRTGNTDLPLWIPLLSGSSARIIAVTLVNPLELIRTKMQSQRLSYTQVGNAVKSMIKVQGITGLWKGLFATVLRDVPFSAIYWTSYESVKQMFNVSTPTIAFSFICGATAGATAAFCTVPLDVVKTHQQIQIGEKLFYSDDPTQRVKMPGTIATLSNIYKTQGIRGLFTGLTPRVVKVAPACAIMIATFEYGKRFFHDHNVKKYQAKIKVESQRYSHNNVDS